MQLLLLLSIVAAAESVAPGSIATEARGALMTWLITGGSILTVLGGLFWWFMINRAPDVIVDAIMLRVDRILRGETPAGQPVTDKDNRELLEGIGMLLIKWAEKKLPDTGLGEQRMRLVLERIYFTVKLIPLAGSRISAKLRENEPKLQQAISKFVEKMDARLRAAEVIKPPLA